MLEVEPPVRSQTTSQAALVRAGLLAGEAGALELAYDLHGGAVYAVARRVCGNPAVAEEISQDVFLHLWQHPDRFDPRRGRLRTYLAMMAHRRSVDWVRSQTARAAREEKSVPASRPHESTEDRALAIIDSEWARTWLKRLPGDQRRCVELAYIHGLTFCQVAERLGIPEGTAKSRIRLGLQRLRSVANEPLPTTLPSSPTSTAGGFNAPR